MFETRTISKTITTIVFTIVLALRGAQAAELPRLNDAAQRNKPYVLLVGLDGFRFDYAERYGARNILAFAKAGASASGLIPCFPSSTFPNFYTIATGLTPEHHGLVGMLFYDRAAGKEFKYFADGQDGSWYGGTPLWVLAERQGMRTATYFWPGSDAEIQGTRPSAYYRFDNRVSNETRIKQVLEWFALPEDQRPHLVTVYFSDVDAAGHRFGPDSEETRQAVGRVDSAVGALVDGLKAAEPAVNVILVSDHGMSGVRRVVYPGDDADLSRFRIMSQSSHLLLYSDDKKLVEDTYRALKGKSTLYRTYRRADLPGSLHISHNARSGDLIIIPTGPYLVDGRTKAERAGKELTTKGLHGYDARQFPEMQGIFYAAGPQIHGGVRLGAISNVSVYRLVTSILDLRPPANLDDNGRLAKKLYTGAVPLRVRGHLNETAR